jgi:hypothetical protein
LSPQLRPLQFGVQRLQSGSLVQEESGQTPSGTLSQLQTRPEALVAHNIPAAQLAGTAIPV